MESRRRKTRLGRSSVCMCCVVANLQSRAKSKTGLVAQSQSRAPAYCRLDLFILIYTSTSTPSDGTASPPIDASNGGGEGSLEGNGMPTPAQGTCTGTRRRVWEPWRNVLREEARLFVSHTQTHLSAWSAGANRQTGPNPSSPR